jgi:hypothetical protein
VADRAIEAIAQKNLKLLDKAKICRVTGHGGMLIRNSMLDATRSVESIWPDRALVTYEFKEGASPKFKMGVNRSFGWNMFGPGPFVPLLNPTETAQILQNDLLGEHWITLGIGLTDPSAVFFDRKQSKTEKGSSSTIKMSVKGRSLYQITFDDQSFLPVKNEYETLEQGTRIKKTIVFSQHKLSEGMMLPGHLELTQDYLELIKASHVVYHWDLDKWEFPDKLDEALFSPPK